MDELSRQALEGTLKTRHAARVQKFELTNLLPIDLYAQELDTSGRPGEPIPLKQLTSRPVGVYFVIRAAFSGALSVLSRSTKPRSSTSCRI
ncbi:hypothetical protein ACIBQ1_60830 [Nonomuraea sp. NPDC050153]|uniref:hypothetical protein n=1 Tax=Nonomuraea sp. NPDC050153 TaxID=3364359 RepID=UPI0037B2E031